MPAPIAIDFPVSILNRAVSGASSRFWLETVNQMTTGATSGKALYSGPGYDLWRAEIPLTALDDDQWRDLEGFIAGLDTNRGLVRVFDPLRQRPRGTVSNTGTGAGEPWGDDTPWADGTYWNDLYYDGLTAAEDAPQDRDTILLAGCVVSQSRAVASGDHFNINGFLYMATADAPSNDEGLTRVQIRPRLRENVATGDEVKFSRATCVMRITSQGGANFSRAHITRWGDGALTLVEAIAE